MRLGLFSVHPFLFSCEACYIFFASMCLDVRGCVFLSCISWVATLASL